MIKIAVCDDDYLVTSEMEEMLYSVCGKEGILVDIDILYCGAELEKELEKGVIQSNRSISWLPKKCFVGAHFLHKGSELLSEANLMHGAVVVAYLCRACEKVIIDYGENEEASL